MATADGKIQEFDGSLRTLYAHGARPYRMAFSTDGRFLASGAEDGSVIVYDFLQERNASRLSAHSALVMSVVWNGHDLWTSSADGTMKQWRIIGVLARFVEADVGGHRSRGLLESAVSWLLKSVPSDRPRFGTSWPVVRREFRRIGWCYGDAGVAGVLLRASRALRSRDLENEALDLLRQIATPSLQRGIADASFCHGAAGLAHIYNVAFQCTKSLQMRTEARRWLVEVLRLRKAGTGIAGYTSLKIDGRKLRRELTRP